MTDREHYRRSDDGSWQEWSIDTTGQVMKGKPSRAFLRVDARSVFCLELTEDLVTSRDSQARALDTEHARSFPLSGDLLEWLIRVGPAALAALETKWSEKP